jgi:hypothetical protein
MLRSQMLIHSCIYYELDKNIISDHEWQARADRLTRLQARAKDKLGHCNIGWYDREFADWDGSTGCHLPLRSAWVMRKAQQLLEREKQYGEDNARIS